MSVDEIFRKPRQRYEYRLQLNTHRYNPKEAEGRLGPPAIAIPSNGLLLPSSHNSK